MLELYDKGYTSDQIVCETGLAQTTVNRYIRDAKGSRYMQRYKHDAEIVQMYDEGLSIMDMSEKLDVPDHYVRNMLRRLRAEGKIGWRNRGWEEKGRFVPSRGGEEAKALQRRMGIRPLVKSV